MQNNELVAYYQPLVDGHTNRVVAVEALMRWNRPEVGLVPPAQFIHVAEESGSSMNSAAGFCKQQARNRPPAAGTRAACAWR